MTPSALVLQHLSLVRAIAAGVKRAVPFADMDDLCGFGTIGLIRASRRYREGAVPFSAFAWHRIKGSMLDGVRVMAGGLGMHLERVSLNHLDTLEADVEPMESVLDRRREAVDLREAIAALPDRERVLVEAVDLGGMGLEEAGRVMGVSKSWASRVRARGLDNLRQVLS